MSQDKNQYIFDFFKKVKESGKLAHGYLFWGPNNQEGINVAFWLKKLLQIGDFDVLQISIEKDKKEISINQIRAAKKHLNLSPFSGLYKLAIINEAEKMNSEAANALLKILEEPHRNTVLILITSEPKALPKTIISRLQEVRFYSNPLSEISKIILNKNYNDILDKSLNNLFKDLEKIVKEETEIIPLLDSWMLMFRGKMIESAKTKKKNKFPEIIREIQKTKNIISLSNVNHRLALENLVLSIKY